MGNAQLSTASRDISFGKFFIRVLHTEHVGVELARKGTEQVSQGWSTAFSARTLPDWSSCNQGASLLIKAPVPPPLGINPV
jgi:hypothetical protein